MCMAKRGYTARDEERPYTAGYLAHRMAFHHFELAAMD